MGRTKDLIIEMILRGELNPITGWEAQVEERDTKKEQRKYLTDKYFDL